MSDIRRMVAGQLTAGLLTGLPPQASDFVPPPTTPEAKATYAVTLYKAVLAELAKTM